jgi:hypothetical protein
LRALLSDLRAYYQAAPTKAAELVGESSADEAAWTLLCSTVMNLDEFVNK